MALTRKNKVGLTLSYGVDGAGGPGSALIADMGAAVSTAGDKSAPMATITAVEVSGELEVNATAKDGEGLTKGHLIGAPKHSIKVDGHASAVAVPKLGESITHAGVSGAVVASSIVASNEDFVKASLTAEGAPGIAYT